MVYNDAVTIYSSESKARVIEKSIETLDSR